MNVAQKVVGKPTFANALKLFPLTPDGKEYLNIVRVRDGVASVTNGHVLIRRSVMVENYQSVPDGCYDVRLGGELVQTRNPHGLKYPDIDLVCPDGINPRSGKTQISPLCQIPKEAISFMVPLVQKIHKEYEGTVVMDKNGIWMRQNPAICMAYPFNLPTATTINPFYLEFVLIEMLQYPMIYLLREHRQEDGQEQRTPLIFGLNWANCGLVMPTKETGE